MNNIQKLNNMSRRDELFKDFPFAYAPDSRNVQIAQIIGNFYFTLTEGYKISYI